uniref:Uncharacterized protein n=1 Tax=Hyaloperonospora arabidopsidis (strain Emoy2) TaxID=559515 RepID=M4B657_HYAAE
MTTTRRLQACLQRWHLLGRYHVNKWHYDASKWLDRLLYATGSTGNGPQVASVAFMITRNMRQQLMDAGFPASAIATLQPATAQKIIAGKVTFEKFEELQKLRQVEEAGATAKLALKKEAEQQETRQNEGVAVEGRLEEEQQLKPKQTVNSTALTVMQEKAVDDKSMKETKN